VMSQDIGKTPNRGVCPLHDKFGPPATGGRRGA
jgi:hypothetical protein